MVASPYGSWTSPITSDLVVAETIRLDQVALDGDAIYWTESQPKKQGRTFVYRAASSGEPEAVTPDDASAFNVRSRVHEYGGGAFVVQDGTVFFSNFADQRLYRQDAGDAPRPISPAATPASALRYADGVIDRQRRRLICVHEDHTGSGHAVNALVSLDLSAAHHQERAPKPLVTGNDFYATPRLSPDGARLAWLTWNHPDMPWVAAEAWVGEIQADGMVTKARRIAGGPDEAVFQPQWSADGDLWFVSDRTGWWNLYREHDGAIEPMAPMDAEFGQAQWNFAMSTYAFESAQRVVCCFVRDGIWRLALLDIRTKRFEPISLPFTSLSQLRAGPGRAVFLGGSPSEASALIELDLATGSYRVIRRSAVLSDELRPYISVAQPISFPTTGGETAHAFYYPPRSPRFSAPAGEKAPVLVKSHGGPTSSASSTLSLAVQYWTSRGIGVLDVNYRGSTGYGRPYRLRLQRQWGIVDVEDCIAGARHLVETADADPERLMISGGSAGGYTTLRALTPANEKTFSAGASYYGVSDLAALARDTHKFESRYLDWLIGRYPLEEQTYAQRSPIHHIDRLSVPVIFFQGAEDRIVPPNQTEMMVAGLKHRGIPVGYLLFDGEQHGFRKAETIKRALDAELYFYASLVLRSGLHFQ
ncbi:MAG: S9 family peptidase [Alphaproteobacteria bacterium]|nr:S9 family peptidase [Alphaproteobacteria bacterium]MBV8407795.1 S9 family peptidase [Alphaproteobacteria bacterium]